MSECGSGACRSGPPRRSGPRFARRGLGYGAVWIGESHANREIFAHAATLLGCTERIVVATGVASIWSRDPSASANGAAALAEAFPGRFVLTLGVSHAPIVTRRGHAYERPLAAMREHLDGMAATRYAAPAPAEPAPLLFAALAPGMMRLAAERTDGAHPYLVTPGTPRRAGDARAGEDPRPRAGVVVVGRPRDAPARRRGSTSPSTSRWRTTRAAGGGSASRRPTWRTAARPSRGRARRVGRRGGDGGPRSCPSDCGRRPRAVQALGPDPLAQLERLAPILTALSWRSASDRQVRRMPRPADVEEGGLELVERPDPEVREAVVDLLTEELEHVAHARLARSEVGPHVRAAEHHGPRPERKGADHVDATAHAAVEEDLDLVTHGGDDLRERAEGRHAAVEVVAAVVRDDDRVDALGHCSARIIGAEDPLHDQRPLPELPQPRNVLPPRRLLVHRLDATVEAVHRLPFVVQRHRDRRLRDPVAQKVGQPARPHEHLGREAYRLPGPHPLRHARALPERPLPGATRRRRRVDGQDEPVDAGALDPLDDRLGRLAAAKVIELVEDRP